MALKRIFCILTFVCKLILIQIFKEKMSLIHRCIPPFLAIFLIAFIASNNNNVAAMRLQAVAAKGVLLCGSRPASGVKVKLFDDVYL
jgi:hypothetical protein